MTQDQVTQRAREVGLTVGIHCPLPQLARLIELARADERERCAVAAWSTGMSLHRRNHDAREIGSACAEAIRALGD